MLPSYDEITAQPPQVERVITKQPASSDIEKPYEFEWDVPQGGSYGSFLNALGEFFGIFGMIPGCFCIPNPFKKVKEGNVVLITRFGKLYRGAGAGIIKTNIVTDRVHHVEVNSKVRETKTEVCRTRDRKSVGLTAIIFYHISEPHKVFLNPIRLGVALDETTKSIFSHLVELRDYEDVMGHRRELAAAAAGSLQQSASTWGVHVESLNIKSLYRR
ncbi:unnamed protein product [Kuraishia capsulata CBS 1993]|uniref:Band 7 domain-containing protein n=1 Tax=Kuraishia capsulata CBS 1993 TaxID=1382522 RepID=W6MNA8_9ASCO|nr:uncharacterized protein KUCA_T00004125001 [Kuraishia capsulata CBS 1993]CDK28144.1 unnamed protein product [Kuraishia capsulata CBS 1993]